MPALGGKERQHGMSEAYEGVLTELIVRIQMLYPDLLTALELPTLEPR